jgi:hypothetical protein
VAGILPPKRLRRRRGEGSFALSKYASIFYRASPSWAKESDDTASDS